MATSWVNWLKAEIDKALPTNTSGGITAEAERGILYKIVEKSDPLPYVTELEGTVNASMVELEQGLRVKIAEVNLKADQTSQALADHVIEFQQVNGEVTTLKETVGNMGTEIAQLQGTVASLGNAITALTQRVEALENPQPTK